MTKYNPYDRHTLEPKLWSELVFGILYLSLSALCIFGAIALMMRWL